MRVVVKCHNQQDDSASEVPKISPVASSRVLAWPLVAHELRGHLLFMGRVVPCCSRFVWSLVAVLLVWLGRVILNRIVELTSERHESVTGPNSGPESGVPT